MLAGMVFSIGNARFGFMLGSKRHKGLKNSIMEAIGHPKYQKTYEAPKTVYIRPRDALGRFVAYKEPKQIVTPIAVVPTAQDCDFVPPTEGGLS
mgnify:CR=1 FL=1